VAVACGQGCACIFVDIYQRTVRRTQDKAPPAHTGAPSGAISGSPAVPVDANPISASELTGNYRRILCLSGPGDIARTEAFRRRPSLRIQYDTIANICQGVRRRRPVLLAAVTPEEMTDDRCGSRASLRGAKRRSNPGAVRAALDCFVAPAGHPAALAPRGPLGAPRNDYTAATLRPGARGRRPQYHVHQN
jgi:hypothetical protein